MSNLCFITDADLDEAQREDERKLRVEALQLAIGLMKEYYRDGQSVPGIRGKQVDVEEKTVHVAEEFYRWLETGGR